jgi:hypothetical protein
MENARKYIKNGQKRKNEEHGWKRSKIRLTTVINCKNGREIGLTTVINCEKWSKL